MMPAAVRTLLCAAERQALQAGLCRVSLRTLTKVSRSLASRPLYSLLKCDPVHPRSAASFASAALPIEEKRVAEGERSSPSDKASKWLEVDSLAREPTVYTQDLSEDAESVSRAAQAATDSSSGNDGDSDEHDEGLQKRFRSSADAGTSLELEQAGDEDDLPPLDWSDSDEEVTPRQTKYSPHGPKPKRRWPEKKWKGIGKKAVIAPMPDFDSMLPRLQAYKEKFGDCLVPKRFWEDFELGDWTHRIRSLLREKRLPVRQFEILEAMDFPWVVPEDVASWEFMYQEMRRYQEEFGNLEIPFKWKDPMADFNNHFAKWFHTQPTLFLQRRLRPDQVRKLMVAGYNMQEVTGDDIGKADYMKAQQQISSSADKNEFEIMFSEMEGWKATYYTTVVPRMVYDNPVLGMWAWKVRKDYRNNKLAQWKIDRLSKLEFLWKVDPITSKWHHNLHELRRYKEVHGTANIPAEYRNPAEPAWQEAARWVQRQAKLFRKQKLSDKRYRIMREVLGIKFVRQYAPRVKENRHKMGIQVTHAKRMPKYAPPIRKNVLI